MCKYKAVVVYCGVVKVVDLLFITCVQIVSTVVRIKFVLISVFHSELSFITAAVTL